MSATPEELSGYAGVNTHPHAKNLLRAKEGLASIGIQWKTVHTFRHFSLETRTVALFLGAGVTPTEIPKLETSGAVDEEALLFLAALRGYE